MVLKVVLDLNVRTPALATREGYQHDRTTREGRSYPEANLQQTHVETISSLKWLTLISTAWGAQQQSPSDIAGFVTETWRRSKTYRNRIVENGRPFPDNDNRSLRSQLLHEENSRKEPWKMLITNPAKWNSAPITGPKIDYFLGDSLPHLDEVFDAGFGVLACMTYACHVEQPQFTGMVPLAQMSLGQFTMPVAGRRLTEYGLIAQLPVITMTSARLARVTARVINYLATHSGNTDLLGSFLYRAIPAEFPARSPLTNNQLIEVISTRLRHVLVQALMACMIDEALSSRYEPEVALLRDMAKSVHDNLKGLDARWRVVDSDLARVQLPPSERLKPGIDPEAAKHLLVGRIQKTISDDRWFPMRIN